MRRVVAYVLGLLLLSAVAIEFWFSEALARLPVYAFAVIGLVHSWHLVRFRCPKCSEVWGPSWDLFQRRCLHCGIAIGTPKGVGESGTRE
jgi:hypothetical protein